MTPADLDAAVDLIARHQADPASRITFLANEAPGIRAELDGLTPPWATTVRVVRDGDRITGVSVAEWDPELGRGWIHGPWADDWADAPALLDAALAQLPGGIERWELAGDVAHARLAALAAERGLHATEPNHVLVADAAVVATWPADDGTDLRPATTADVEAIAALHDVEFPNTYASAAQLVADEARVTLVADDGTGGVAGYAAGEVHEDGEGFLDFLVVHPDHRRRHLGSRLIAAVTRELLPRAPLGRVGLTVQDSRAPARAAYAALGFRPDGVLVAYRSWQ